MRRTRYCLNVFYYINRPFLVNPSRNITKFQENFAFSFVRSKHEVPLCCGSTPIVKLQMYYLHQSSHLQIGDTTIK